MNHQQRQQQYYDPEQAALGQQGDGMVLKPRIFKPLRNNKTGHFLSYSYSVAERNQSPNNDPDIHWVTAAPQKMQERINTVREMHQDAVILHQELIQAMKDEHKPAIRAAKRAIVKQTSDIDEFIYPETEREYVESKEHKRFRLEQQNELTLDAASIAALRGEQQAPMGSTADASIAEAKLELAEARIKKLEEEAKAVKMGAMKQPEAPKAASRPKAAAKPK